LSVLVTGGAGYIGCHVARTLRQRGETVIVCDNLSRGHRSLVDGIELVEADIADAGTLANVLKRVDSVMHFAAFAYVGESVTDPQKYFQNNIAGGLAFLDSILRSQVRTIIFSSTCAVYGVPTQPLISEDHVRMPVNPYGFSKLVFEQALEAYGAAYGLRHVSFRYFNAAGADQSGEIGEIHDPEPHLIPAALGAVSGRRPPLEVFGDDYPTPDGTCIRDYVHVNDLAEAHVAGLDYLRRGAPSTAFNLGTGKGYSVREVLSAVERVTGRRVPNKMAARRAGDPPALVADPSRAAKVLGWKAKRSLERIVETAHRWHSSRWSIA
jgi:UDP-arabinose 4-epimerase